MPVPKCIRLIYLNVYVYILVNEKDFYRFKWLSKEFIVVFLKLIKKTGSAFIFSSDIHRV